MIANRGGAAERILTTEGTEDHGAFPVSPAVGRMRHAILGDMTGGT